MQSHYFFSQCYFDDPHRIPVCCAYGGHWHVPVHGKDLTDPVIVLMLSTAMQMEAARQDPRVLVLPYLFDPSPVDERVIEAYKSMGATSGMSLAVLLAKLAETEPRFAHELRV